MMCNQNRVYRRPKLVQRSVISLAHPSEITVYMSSYGNLNHKVIGNFIPDRSRKR